jgi:membrane associated rhomboid family serine protease
MTGESPLDRFQRWYRLLPPALRFLLTANTVVFVAWLFLRLSDAVAGFVVGYLALTPSPVAFVRPWQFLTHSVLHLEASFWGLIAFAFNMLWLYWMGRDYEETYGSHRIFGLYVLSAVGGGLLAVLVGSAFGAAFPVWGAMGAVFGVLFCVATLNPDRGLGLLIIGVVPLKWLAGGFLVLSVVFSLGHPALVMTYLGGAGVGFVFARAQQRGTDLAAWAQAFFPPRNAYGGHGAARAGARRGEKEGVLARLDRWVAGRKKGEDARGRASTPRADAPSPRRTKRKAAVSADAVGPGDIDRILDKINERGYDALTEEEKRALYEASRE